MLSPYKGHHSQRINNCSRINTNIHTLHTTGTPKSILQTLQEHNQTTLDTCKFIISITGNSILQNRKEIHHVFWCMTTGSSTIQEKSLKFYIWILRRRDRLSRDCNCRWCDRVFVIDVPIARCHRVLGQELLVELNFFFFFKVNSRPFIIEYIPRIGYWK